MKDKMASSTSWEKIFYDYRILEHDFKKSPFYLTAKQIKISVQDYKKTAEKEVRILCKMDTRESLPQIMRQHGLFLLPVKNGEYVIIKGEGYVDIPDVAKKPILYKSKLGFNPVTSKVGNSEMQHLDFAYATSLIRTFMQDPTLILTIRGRKYTPEFSFNVNNIVIDAKSVQTEVDAGFEGMNKIVLIEAKNTSTKNTIIRQMYYPFRQWSSYTKKEVILLFFEKRLDEYVIWEYKFNNINDYNSIHLNRAEKYKIV